MVRHITLFYLFIFLFIGCNQKATKENKSDVDSTEIEVSFGNDQTNSNNSILPKEFILKRDNSTLILIPQDSFIYGIDKSIRDSILDMLSNAHLEIFDDEFPLSKKYLPSYYIDKFEITNDQYNKFISETGHKKPRFWSNKLYNHPDQPVVGIGWEDAAAYAKWAGKRLPSEEEWEKAARGTKGFIWPWGNDPSGEKYNGKSQGNYIPTTVGSFPIGESPYGVLDMAGNVYEMTTGKWRSGNAMRGGSFLNSGAYTRTMFRWAMEDEINGAEWLGFRCAADTSIVTSQ